MKNYGDYLAQIFPGIKVQKISVDAGFTCPNRDGTISSGGCLYCRNDSFSPGYCDASKSVTSQLESGKKFFSRKYPEMKYLAYFQSYTGTYKKDIKTLFRLYSEALSVSDIIGLVIATRPDCIEDEVINLLEEINRSFPVFVEFGAETSHNDTLRIINRNHTWEDLVRSVKKVAEANIHCGIHLIAGLPNEDDDKVMETIDKTIQLPIETIKLHQLQVLKDTPLHQKLQKGEIQIPYYSLEDYLNLCVRIVKRVPQNIIIERFLSQSPPEMVISPKWELKNYQFISKLAKLLSI